MASSSLSGPRGYITVRTEAKKGDKPPNELYASYVENRPYLPLLNVDPANLDTVINVAKIIVSSLLCNNNDNGDGATNSNNDDTDIEGEENVTVITGGLTNALFKVDLPNNINGTAKYPSVLVRIFGADGMINRDEETTNFVRLCSSHDNNVVHDQLDVLGRFGNGRVETWIPNMRQAHHIHDFKIEGFELEVARQLARLHYGFDVTNVAFVQDDDDEDDGDQQQERKKQHEPTLWKVIKTWIDELSQQLSHEKFQKVASSDASSTTPSLVGLFSFAIMNNDSYQKASSNDQIQQQCTDNIISSLYNELEWLKERVATNFPNASTVFCHNDVNAANILLDTTSVTSIDDNNHDKDEEGQDQGTHSSNSYNQHNVCIIDYEYGSINYAMYDIANYICEYCGGNDNGIPNHDLLPTYDRLRKFLIEYVNERDAILSSSKKEEGGGGGGGDRKPNDGIDEEVAHLMSQVELFQIASNLYWGVWGVLQAAGEVVVPEEESDHDGASKFNNLEDAMSRLDGKIDLTRWDNLRYGSNRLKRYHVCKERMN